MYLGGAQRSVRFLRFIDVSVYGVLLGFPYIPLKLYSLLAALRTAQLRWLPLQVSQVLYGFVPSLYLSVFWGWFQRKTAILWGGFKTGPFDFLRVHSRNPMAPLESTVQGAIPDLAGRSPTFLKKGLAGSSWMWGHQKHRPFGNLSTSVAE